VEQGQNPLHKVFTLCYYIGDTVGQSDAGPDYVCMQGVQDDWRGRMNLVEFARRMKAIHARHGDIEDDQVGI
jgi:hypothetical protein